MVSMLGWKGSVAAQDQMGRVQKITGRLQAGETEAYILKDLQPGDRLTVSLRTRSGNLDPAVGIIDTTVPLEEVITRYQMDIQNLLADNENMVLSLEEVVSQYFLAWNDDGGEGYAAALEYVVPTAGDYMLITGASLSSLGRVTFFLLLQRAAPSTLLCSPGLCADPPDHPHLLVHLLSARFHSTDRSRGRQHPAFYRLQLQPGRQLPSTRLHHLSGCDHGRDFRGKRPGVAL